MCVVVDGRQLPLDAVLIAGSAAFARNRRPAATPREVDAMVATFLVR